MKIAIFYGSTYGNTAAAAEKISFYLGQMGLEHDLKDIAHSQVEEAGGLRQAAAGLLYLEHR